MGPWGMSARHGPITHIGEPAFWAVECGKGMSIWTPTRFPLYLKTLLSRCSSLLAAPTAGTPRTARRGAQVQGEDSQEGAPSTWWSQCCYQWKQWQILSQSQKQQKREPQGLEVLMNMACDFFSGPPWLSNCLCCRLGWGGKARGFSGGGLWAE